MQATDVKLHDSTLATPQCNNRTPRSVSALQISAMSEHWKSTPSHWCKFCGIYVRDTTLERKNHEASAKHQNGIQRNLRELQKGKQREERERQRAKDEVARLNGLVGGAKNTTPGPNEGTAGAASKRVHTTATPQLSASAQRKAHAEQLAALGVELPEELKREVTGVGGWQTISERVVEEVKEEQPWSSGSIKTEGDNKEDVKDAIIRGVRKRKVDDEDEEAAAAAASRRKAWGSSLKTYPGASQGGGDEGNLDALLSGVTKRKAVDVQGESVEAQPVKQEDLGEEKPLSAIPDFDAPPTSIKQEDDAETPVAPPTVVFKKRRVKK